MSEREPPPSTSANLAVPKHKAPRRRVTLDSAANYVGAVAMGSASAICLIGALEAPTVIGALLGMTFAVGYGAAAVVLVTSQVQKLRRQR